MLTVHNKSRQFCFLTRCTWFGEAFVIRDRKKTFERFPLTKENLSFSLNTTVIRKAERRLVIAIQFIHDSFEYALIT